MFTSLNVNNILKGDDSLKKWPLYLRCRIEALRNPKELTAAH